MDRNFQPKGFHTVQRMGCVTGVAALCCFASVVWADLVPTTLVTFNITNGTSPRAGLVQGSDGYFYGTTVFGGTNNLGEVFRVSAAGDFKVLYSFTGGVDGASPHGPLIQARDGNFYGTTSTNGAGGYGTVFRVTPQGVLTTLASLSGANGATPESKLVEGPDGALYGTASYAGLNMNRMSVGGYGCGAVFRVSLDGQLSTVFLFNGTNGLHPNGLVLGRDGNFYGTTIWGGATFKNPNSMTFGTVFRLTPDGQLTTFVSLDGNVGGWVYGDLVLGNDGNFYGTTQNGGPSYVGTVFRLTPAGVYTQLFAFGNGTGAYPYAGLVQGADGNFYGTTCYGQGTVFRITPQGVQTKLYTFTGGVDGGTPQAPLIQGSDGALYGTALSGGTAGLGTVFRLAAQMSPVFRSMTQVPGGVRFSYTTVADCYYQAQYSTNLPQGNWQNLTDVFIAQGGLTTNTDNTSTDPKRFYRVVGLPPK